MFPGSWWRGVFPGGRDHQLPHRLRMKEPPENGAWMWRDRGPGDGGQAGSGQGGGRSLDGVHAEGTGDSRPGRHTTENTERREEGRLGGGCREGTRGTGLWGSSSITDPACVFTVALLCPVTRLARGTRVATLSSPLPSLPGRRGRRRPGAAGGPHKHGPPECVQGLRSHSGMEAASRLGGFARAVSGAWRGLLRPRDP